jgi:hypothetical protein
LYDVTEVVVVALVVMFRISVSCLGQIDVATVELKKYVPEVLYVSPLTGHVNAPQLVIVTLVPKEGGCVKLMMVSQEFVKLSVMVSVYMPAVKLLNTLDTVVAEPFSENV